MTATVTDRFTGSPSSAATDRYTGVSAGGLGYFSGSYFAASYFSARFFRGVGASGDESSITDRIDTDPNSDSEDRIGGYRIVVTGEYRMTADGSRRQPT